MFYIIYKAIFQKCTDAEDKMDMNPAIKKLTVSEEIVALEPHCITIAWKDWNKWQFHTVQPKM